MAIFSPDTVLPTDAIGFGWWINAHALEHDQFVRIGFANVPFIAFPQYDLYSWNGDNAESIRGWLDAHEQMHAALRAQSNVEGSDLSQVDWGQDADRLVWMDTHAFEHHLLRTAFGIS